MDKENKFPAIERAMKAFHHRLAVEGRQLESEVVKPRAAGGSRDQLLRKVKLDDTFLGSMKDTSMDRGPPSLSLPLSLSPSSPLSASEEIKGAIGTVDVVPSVLLEAAVDVSLANNIYQEALDMYEMMAHDYIKTADAVIDNIKADSSSQPRYSSGSTIRGKGVVGDSAAGHETDYYNSSLKECNTGGNGNVNRRVSFATIGEGGYRGRGRGSDGQSRSHSWSSPVNRDDSHILPPSNPNHNPNHGTEEGLPYSSAPNISLPAPSKTKEGANSPRYTATGYNDSMKDCAGGEGGRGATASSVSGSVLHLHEEAYVSGDISGFTSAPASQGGGLRTGSSGRSGSRDFVSASELDRNPSESLESISLNYSVSVSTATATVTDDSISIVASDRESFLPPPPRVADDGADDTLPPLDNENEETSDDDYDMKVVEQWRSAYSRRGLANRVRHCIRQRANSTKGEDNGPTSSRIHRERINQRVSRVAVKKWQAHFESIRDRQWLMYHTNHDGKVSLGKEAVERIASLPSTSLAVKVKSRLLCFGVKLHTSTTKSFDKNRISASEGRDTMSAMYYKWRAIAFHFVKWQLFASYNRYYDANIRNYTISATKLLEGFRSM